ncbi:Oidioi.mRNA.OKI2018_I69.XSR.g15075.t1.cds [Oikopleura dioica]|uniref:Oidioi.mRNA.OKI2018_I69.XSR.g15075.t1.cds n=1 Tax=Oikopleura dioica TaxID=34765 RepID=A0ABN7SGR3_OIKDI|nr:Oidioi.mRNA.OKI2018_I69.XSR.g15075.t1.cds [Oikopleura dioica]
MLKAFNRSTCGFFDPTIPHGGPNPNPRKRRDRRNTENSDFEDLQRMFFQIGLSESPFQGRYDRENPATGIQQITTGFRKWTERYISECHGQRLFEYQVKRMERWRNILRDHFKKTVENQA